MAPPDGQGIGFFGYRDPQVVEREHRAKERERDERHQKRYAKVREREKRNQKRLEQAFGKRKQRVLDWKERTARFWDFVGCIVPRETREIVLRCVQQELENELGVALDEAESGARQWLCVSLFNGQFLRHVSTSLYTSVLARLKNELVWVKRRFPL
jgi:hypothetical protein